MEKKRIIKALYWVFIIAITTGVIIAPRDMTFRFVSGISFVYCVAVLTSDWLHKRYVRKAYVVIFIDYNSGDTDVVVSCDYENAAKKYCEYLNDNAHNRARGRYLFVSVKMDTDFTPMKLGVTN